MSLFRLKNSNYTSQKLDERVLLLGALALACFAISPMAQALFPAPDGGYSGRNTAEGTSALLSLTSGIDNTAVGWFSLKSDTTGGFNTAIGAGALYSNTAGGNTATGAAALFSNTTGSVNTAYGALALFHNTTGGGHTAVGFNALGATNASDFLEGNTAVGSSALTNDTDGNANTAVGFGALLSNTTGSSDSAIGNLTLGANTIGNNNTATGFSALLSNTTGDDNTASGYQALMNNTLGGGNTAIGVGALQSNTEGLQNVALGSAAGIAATTGSFNVYIGAGENGVAGESHACYIASIFNQTSVSGVPVLINANDKLGTMTSSRRFKDHIRPMDEASEELYALQPVTFRYKKELDPQGIPQWGLVAEEVEKVNPDLIVRDKEGKPYSVRYDQVNVMLLNEFLKEHKTVQEQGATITRQRKDFEAAIARQQKKIEALTATVKAQAAQIQKVSAQLELNKPAPQTVLNNR